MNVLDKQIQITNNVYKDNKNINKSNIDSEKSLTKIDKIKKDIENGNYKVDLNKITNSILEKEFLI